MRRNWGEACYASQRPVSRGVNVSLAGNSALLWGLEREFLLHECFSNVFVLLTTRIDYLCLMYEMKAFGPNEIDLVKCFSFIWFTHQVALVCD